MWHQMRVAALSSHPRMVAPLGFPNLPTPTPYLIRCSQPAPPAGPAEAPSRAKQEPRGPDVVFSTTRGRVKGRTRRGVGPSPRGPFQGPHALDRTSWCLFRAGEVSPQHGRVCLRLGRQEREREGGERLFGGGQQDRDSADSWSGAERGGSRTREEAQSLALPHSG